jgi:hypothetical protein
MIDRLSVLALFGRGAMSDLSPPCEPGTDIERQAC